MDSDSHPTSPETSETSDDVVDFTYSLDTSIFDKASGTGENRHDADNDELEVEGYVEKELPEELALNVVMLSCYSSVEEGICDVYLVGTVHLSPDSCREVEAVINFLKPEVVFLELCSNRVGLLTHHLPKIPTMGEMVDMWKKNHNIIRILFSWLLAKAGNKLEVSPGNEFRVAYEEAMKYGGRVILGDRPINITFRRAWLKMTLWHKAKLIYFFMFQAIFFPSTERLNERFKKTENIEVTPSIQRMSKEFPVLTETLIHERDRYMSSTLLDIASRHSCVVAVVGKAHLQGIEEHWEQPVEMNDLQLIPSATPAVSARTLLLIIAGVAIVLGIYL